MKHNYVVIKAYSVQILTRITFSQDEQTITHDSGNKVRKINRKDEFSGCLKRSGQDNRQSLLSVFVRSRQRGFKRLKISGSTGHLEVQGKIVLTLSG